MTRKQRRSIFILTGMAVMGFAVLLVLTALQDSLVYFYSPSDIETKKIDPGSRIRIGGLVGRGSVVKSNGTQVNFDITDGAGKIQVRYTGLLPDLFREEQGVIAEGRIESTGMLAADTILAKHDENYIPREVAESLKKQGVWRGNGNAATTTK